MAQCSTTRDSVAATPPCSAIRFRMEIDTQHLTPLAVSDKIGAMGSFSGRIGGYSATTRDISKITEICCNGLMVLS